MLIVYDPGEGKPLETMAMARYNVGTQFQKVWDKEKQPDQWKALADIIASKETPAANFYDGLGSLKGVDLTAASLGFKVKEGGKRFIYEFGGLGLLIYLFLSTSGTENMLLFSGTFRL